MKLYYWLQVQTLIYGFTIVWILYISCLSIAHAKPRLTVGAILPLHSFYRRLYRTAVKTAVKDIEENTDLSIAQTYDLVGEVRLIEDYSPPEILDAVCDSILNKQVNTVLYMSNMDYVGEHTASGQYLLQVCNTLGIPVIAWNADNSGFFQVSIVHLFIYFSISSLFPSFSNPLSSIKSS